MQESEISDYLAAMLYEDLLKTQLGRVLKAYISATDLAPATVARRFADDSRFFDRVLDQDCAFTVRQYDRVICRLADAWPDGCKWPKGVPRPRAPDVNEVLSRIARSRAA